MNRSFTKVEIQMINKNMKRGLISLTVNEMQIRTTVRYPHALTRTAKIENDNT